MSSSTVTPEVAKTEEKLDEINFDNKSILENLQKVLQDNLPEELLSQPNSENLQTHLAQDELKNKQQPLQKQHVQQSKHAHQNLAIQNVQQYLQQFFPAQYMAAHNLQQDLQTQHIQASLPIHMRNVQTQMQQMPAHMHVPTHSQNIQMQQHIQWHQQMKDSYPQPVLQNVLDYMKVQRPESLNHSYGTIGSDGINQLTNPIRYNHGMRSNASTIQYQQRCSPSPEYPSSEYPSTSPRGKMYDFHSQHMGEGNLPLSPPNDSPSPVSKTRRRIICNTSRDNFDSLTPPASPTSLTGCVEKDDKLNRMMRKLQMEDTLITRGSGRNLYRASYPAVIERYAYDTVAGQARMNRKRAETSDASCSWSGQLPPRNYKNPTYSCKVFLGGVPWDITESGLQLAFNKFGNLKIEWPGKDGYVYLVFDMERSVRQLLQACTHDFSNGEYFFKISSRRMRSKEVQVIPWVIADSNYNVDLMQYTQRTDSNPARTVFVGALHGMITAEALAAILQDLFGPVECSGIDTDKHKYPIGSGRVTFTSEKGYMKAVHAAFIEIKTAKFNKKLQIDPYLVDSNCSMCNSPQGNYFCRDAECFNYFCHMCWNDQHQSPQLKTHRPLSRNAK